MPREVELNLERAISEGTQHLNRHQKHVQEAIKRSVRKTVLWIRAVVLREFSDKTGLPQDRFKKYNRLKVNTGDQQGYVWLGLNPMPLHEAGQVNWSPQSSGVRVNGKLYEGAFFRSVYSATKKVWIRSSRNKQLGHATYNKRRGHKEFSSQGKVNRGRFPIELLGIELDEVAREMDRRIMIRAEVRFKRFLEEEISKIKGSA
jgi:uncharacterized sporulation protein YeaH/YhbH (DUF444 family)